MIEIIINNDGVFFIKGKDTVAVLTDDGRFFTKSDVGISDSMPTPAMTKIEIMKCLYRATTPELTEAEKPTKPWYKFW